MFAPFSATSALLAMLPDAPFSRPNTLIRSHLVCLALGIAGHSLIGVLPSPILITLCALIAVTLMGQLGCLHAPAAAHTVILSFGKQDDLEYAIWVVVAVVAMIIVSSLKVRVGAQRLAAKRRI